MTEYKTESETTYVSCSKALYVALLVGKQHDLGNEDIYNNFGTMFQTFYVKSI